MEARITIDDAKSPSQTTPTAPVITKNTVNSAYQNMLQSVNGLKALLEKIDLQLLAVKFFLSYMQEHEQKRQQDETRGRNLSELAPILAIFNSHPRTRKEVQTMLLEASDANWFLLDCNYTTLEKIDKKKFIKAKSTQQKSRTMFDEMNTYFDRNSTSIMDFAHALLLIYHRELDRGYYGAKGTKRTCTLYKKINTFFEESGLIPTLSLRDFALFTLCRIRQSSSDKKHTPVHDTIERISRLLITSNGQSREVTAEVIIRVFHNERDRLKNSKGLSTATKYLDDVLARHSLFDQQLTKEIADPHIPATRICMVYYLYRFDEFIFRGRTPDHPLTLSFQTTDISNTQKKPYIQKINIQSHLSNIELDDSAPLKSVKLIPIQNNDSWRSPRFYLLVTVLTADKKYVHAFFSAEKGYIRNQPIGISLARYHVSEPKEHPYVNAVALYFVHGNKIFYACADSVQENTYSCQQLTVVEPSNRTRTLKIGDAPLDPRLLTYDTKFGVIAYAPSRTRAYNLTFDEDDEHVHTLFDLEGTNSLQLQQMCPTHITGQFLLSWRNKCGETVVGLIDLDGLELPKPQPLVTLKPDVAKSYELTADGLVYDTGEKHPDSNRPILRYVRPFEFSEIGTTLDYSQHKQPERSPRHSRFTFSSRIGGRQRQEREDTAHDDNHNDNSLPSPRYGLDDAGE